MTPEDRNQAVEGAVVLGNISSLLKHGMFQVELHEHVAAAIRHLESMADAIQKAALDQESPDAKAVAKAEDKRKAKAAKRAVQ